MGQRDLPDAPAGDSGAVAGLGTSDGRAPHGLFGAGLPGAGSQSAAGDQLADRLLAALPRCFWIGITPAISANGSNFVPTQPSLAGHFLELLHGKPPASAERQATERFADPLRGARVQRFDVCGADCRLDAFRLLFGRDGGDRHLAGPAARRGQRGRAGSDLTALRLKRRRRKEFVAALGSKEKIMGFGHRVYREYDPRSRVVEPIVEQLADNAERRRLYDVGRRIVEVMWREKRIFPNVDFYGALLYHYLDIPQRLFTPLFVLSRISGWSAHILEQRADNRLIRPDADYIGPAPRPFVRMEDR